MVHLIVVTRLEQILSHDTRITSLFTENESCLKKSTGTCHALRPKYHSATLGHWQSIYRQYWELRQTYPISRKLLGDGSVNVKRPPKLTKKEDNGVE